MHRTIQHTTFKAWAILMLATGGLTPFALAATEEDKAQPKDGRTFTPALSERVPEAVSSLPAFGAINWKTTQLPWIGEGPYEGISGAGMVEIEGKIYVVGGFIPGGDGSGDEASHRTSRWTWSFNPLSGEWIQMANAPFRGEYTRAIAAYGKLYLTGGGCQYTGEEPKYRPHADCAVFDPDDGPKGTWTALAPLRVPRTHMAVGHAGERLVVAGGNEYDFDEAGYSHNTIRGVVDVLDLAAPEEGWQTGTPIPGAPRGWCASVARENALYLFGGITWNQNDTTEGIQESLRYDADSDSWMALSPPPLAISGWEGALYMDRYALNVGGVVRPDPDSDDEVIWSDLVLAYDITEDQWLQVRGSLPPGAVFNDPGVVVIGDTIYVLGAEGPDGSHYDYFLVGTSQKD